jgi:hypothetical protein
MTQEDIYEMISEAGMYVSNFDGFIGRVWCSEGYPIDEELFRFAALVAAHEREECAKLCDVLAVDPEHASQITKLAAMAIRDRGEK